MTRRSTHDGGLLACIILSNLIQSRLNQSVFRGRMVRVNVSDAFDYSRYSFKHNFVMTTNFKNCPIGGNTIISRPVKFH